MSGTLYQSSLRVKSDPAAPGIATARGAATGQALSADDSRTFMPPSGQRNTDRWLNSGVFNRNAAQQPAGNVRTAPPRCSSIRTDSQRRLDLSANRTFRITGKLRAVSRGDVFHARNEVVLLAPDTDPVNSAFGRVTAQEPPRSWQFPLSLRYQRLPQNWKRRPACSRRGGSAAAGLPNSGELSAPR